MVQFATQLGSNITSRYVYHVYVAIFAMNNTGNIREVLIFTRRTNSRIHQSRKKYFDDSAAKGKRKFANSKLREKSQNRKFAKI